MKIARTLNDIVRLRKSKEIIEISLKQCDDFMCKNMMCEMVTETCLCKIDKGRFFCLIIMIFHFFPSYFIIHAVILITHI